MAKKKKGGGGSGGGGGGGGKKKSNNNNNNNNNSNNNNANKNKNNANNNNRGPKKSRDTSNNTDSNNNNIPDGPRPAVPPLSRSRSYAAALTGKKEALKKQASVPSIPKPSPALVTKPKNNGDDDPPPAPLTPNSKKGGASNDSPQKQQQPNAKTQKRKRQRQRQRQRQKQQDEASKSNSADDDKSMDEIPEPEIQQPQEEEKQEREIVQDDAPPPLADEEIMEPVADTAVPEPSAAEEQPDVKEDDPQDTEPITEPEPEEEIAPEPVTEDAVQVSDEQPAEDEPEPPVEPAEAPEPEESPAPVETPEEEPESAEVPEPEESPAPVETPEPEEEPAPAEVPEPAEAPEPEEITAPAEVPEPEEEPTPVEAPEPEEEPASAEAPEPEEEPAPVEAPEPEEITAPAEVPEPEEITAPAEVPEPEEEPVPVEAPEPEEPESAEVTEPEEEPESAETPEPEEITAPAEVPEPEEEPESAEAPEPVEEPEPDDEPDAEQPIPRDAEPIEVASEEQTAEETMPQEIEEQEEMPAPEEQPDQDPVMEDTGPTEAPAEEEQTEPTTEEQADQEQTVEETEPIEESLTTDDAPEEPITKEEEAEPTDVPEEEPDQKEEPTMEETETETAAEVPAKEEPNVAEEPVPQEEEEPVAPEPATQEEATTETPEEEQADTEEPIVEETETATKEPAEPILPEEETAAEPEPTPQDEEPREAPVPVVEEPVLQEADQPEPEPIPDDTNIEEKEEDSHIPDGVNLDLFTANEQSLIKLLCSPEIKQSHLFENFSSMTQEAQNALVAQLMSLDSTYPSGGLEGYISNARNLLERSRKGINPLEGWKPSVPTGQTFQIGSPEYADVEALGIKELGAVGFVLVAGGLGERLGYGNIKIGLPTELATGTCYLQYYIEYILALQSKHSVNGTKLPLCIMTSGDTNAGTVQLLESNNYFGMDKDQITIVQQGDGVPALMDNDAKIAIKENGMISTKPHGHGDIHALLFSHNVAQNWVSKGIKWISFFQDTNGLAFHTLPLAIGVSKKFDLVMNSLAVPRKEKQAIGAITKLTHGGEGKTRTINVEYNQLDPMLRANGYADGDSNDPSTGYSPFPGNINQLLFLAGPYANALERTKGAMPEFVNPKYKDAEKVEFKKPTRLECMMQDFPTVLQGEDANRVGFTSIAAELCFSPVKNATSDGAKLQKKGSPPGVAATGEADQYTAVRKILQSVGVQVEEGKVEEYNDISIIASPEIVIKHSILAYPGEYKKVFPTPDKVKISGNSSLVICGSGEIVIESLELDGALVINVEEGAEGTIKDVTISNEGWTRNKVASSDDEVIAMRGYVLNKKETHTITFKSDGSNEGLPLPVPDEPPVVETETRQPPVEAKIPVTTKQVPKEPKPVPTQEVTAARSLPIQANVPKSQDMTATLGQSEPVSPVSVSLDQQDRGLDLSKPVPDPESQQASQDCSCIIL